MGAFTAAHLSLDRLGQGLDLVLAGGLDRGDAAIHVAGQAADVLAELLDGSGRRLLGGLDTRCELAERRIGRRRQAFGQGGLELGARILDALRQLGRQLAERTRGFRVGNIALAFGRRQALVDRGEGLLKRLDRAIGLGLSGIEPLRQARHHLVDHALCHALGIAQLDLGQAMR